MSSSPQHFHKGLLSGKVGLAIAAALALVVVVSITFLTRQKEVDQKSIPSFGESIVVGQDQMAMLPSDAPQDVDGELSSASEPIQDRVDDDVLPSIAPQKEFPVLTIGSENEAAQLAQAKAAAAAAERFNQEKQSRLDVVLNEDAGELASLAKVEISYLLAQWRDAWAAGNTHLYMSFYSDHFVPENEQSLSQWQTKRRNRVIPSKTADIILSNYHVSFEDDLKISMVELDQHYTSGSYDDRSRKKLIFAKEALGWKLIAETTLHKDP